MLKSASYLLLVVLWGFALMWAINHMGNDSPSTEAAKLETTVNPVAFSPAPTGD